MALITFDDMERIAKGWGAYPVPFESPEKTERRFYLNGMVLIWRNGTLYASDGKTPIDRWFGAVIGIMSDLYRLEHTVDDNLHTLEETIARVS
jgi:hypothetical protein